MTEKERILMGIIVQLLKTIQEGTEAKAWSSAAYYSKILERQMAHPAPWKDIKKGDLVLCQTITGFKGVFDFSIGFVEEIITMDNCLIREIGTNRLANIGNERFIPIVDIPEPVLWNDDKQNFYNKVEKAFKYGDFWCYPLGYFNLNKNGSATICIRARYQSKLLAGFTIRWNKKTTIKSIQLEIQKVIERFEMLKNKGKVNE